MSSGDAQWDRGESPAGIPALPPWRNGALAALSCLLLGIWVLLALGALGFRSAFLWTGGALLGAVALLRGLDSRRRLPFTLERREVLLFAAVVALGAVVRIVGFSSFPPPDGQLWEETQTGKVAFESLRYGLLDPYFPLPNLIGEVGFRLFGVSLTALRIPFVVLGCLSVPLLFVAARLLCRSFAAALCGTALFAACGFLAGASRIALETMSPMFTETLAIAAAFWAVAEGGVSAFAFAGVTTGLLALEYFSYKLLPPFLFLYLLLEYRRSFAGGRPGARLDSSRARTALALFLLFGAAMVIPLVATSPREWLDFFLEGYRRQRAGLAAAGAGLSFADSLWRALARVAASASFVFIEGTTSDVLPVSVGLVDPLLGAGAAVSILYCLWRARREPACFFLAACSLALVVLAGVLVGNPARYRLIPLLPLLCLAAARTIDAAWTVERGRRAVRVVLVGAVVVCGAYEIARFVDATRDGRVQDEFYDLSVILAQEIGRLQAAHPEQLVYLVSDRSYLGVANDYDFLYDPAGVRCTLTPPPWGAAGMVLTHDPYRRLVRSWRDVSDCREWPTHGGSSLVALCRYSAGTASEPASAATGQE